MSTDTDTSSNNPVPPHPTGNTTPYYFIEERYPQNDPNIDLNFDNDMIYGALLNDELDKYNTPFVSVPEVPASKNEKKQSIRADQRSNDSDSRVYVAFIIIVIVLVIIWYIYGGESKKKPNIIDTYPDQPEMIMMSPDFGMDARYRI
jgi:hypothetical protein